MVKCKGKKSYTFNYLKFSQIFWELQLWNNFPFSKTYLNFVRSIHSLAVVV